MIQTRDFVTKYRHKYSYSKNSNFKTFKSLHLTRDDTTTVNSKNVYYLEEDEEGRFEVFGDDVIGRKLVMEILSSSLLLFRMVGTKWCKSFVPVSGVGGYSNVVVSTVTNGVGGGKDSITKIKFNDLEIIRAKIGYNQRLQKTS